MRILCTSAQLPGHLDWGGYLRTAAELHRRGHDVRWATGAAMAPFLQQAGVPIHTLTETGWRWPPPPPLQPEPEMEPEDLRRQRAGRALDQWLDEERVTAATAALIALGKAFQPDLLVSELFLSAAGLAAEALAVPFASAGWPAMRPKETGGHPAVVQEAQERLARLCARFGVSGVNWTEVGPPAQQSPTLHLTYWSPTWYREVDLLPQTVHVGGSAPAAMAATPLPWSEELPWVLITLGTSFGKDANFFVMAAQAAVEIGCLPILVLAGQFNQEEETALRSRLPTSAVIEPRVDLNAVLPHVVAAIHHGGAGVTHALVTHGVPQIIVPHAADQFHQAQGVVRSGVGVYLAAKETTVERLVSALAQTLPDLAAARQNAGALREEFAALGGVAKAADLLEALV